MIYATLYLPKLSLTYPDGRSHSEITGLNPAGDMDVRLL
jgi:hypothetical protein